LSDMQLLPLLLRMHIVITVIVGVVIPVTVVILDAKEYHKTQ